MPLSPLATLVGPRARTVARPLAGGTVLRVAAVLVALAQPWPLALAVDYAIGDRSASGSPLSGWSPDALLIVAALAIVVLTGLGGLLDMAAVVTTERAAERVGAQLRQDVFDDSLALSLRWHDRTHSGELISRLTTDVGRVLDALVALSATLLPDLVRLVLVLVLLLAISPPLAFVALAVVPVLAAFAVKQRHRVRSAELAARAASGRFVATASELLRNVRAVQAFGRADHCSDGFRAGNQTLLLANQRAVTTEARWTPVADLVLAVGAGLVLLVGGREVLAGRLSVGDLLVVTTYVSALYSPVRGLSRLSGVLAKSSVSAGRLADVFASTERLPERVPARPAPMITSGVEFDDVRFGYAAERPVLDGFDLTVRAGETVCLYGPSGAGKSTLLALLLRLYEVDAGSIRLDGTDVRELSLTSLRRRIAYVPQDPWLFDTTIAENIAFGRPGATRSAIARAGRLALVDEFVGRLPLGYDSPVGEGAVRLSGGQRKRIGLARAAVSAAPLVLLDEPTASLDAESAALVTDAIRRFVVGRTAIVVTHDRNLAALADRVVHLDQIVAAAAEPALTSVQEGR